MKGQHGTLTHPQPEADEPHRDLPDDLKSGVVPDQFFHRPGEADVLSGNEADSQIHAALTVQHNNNRRIP